jgi:O-antigen/teichoic acid export membrane protein
MIRRNLSAQVYSQAVTLLIQLGTVPLLISAWGNERYGVWLLLTAIPTYLALGDFGFTFVAKNDMVMRAAAHDRQGALVTYQSIFALLSAIVLTFAVLLAAGLLVAPLDKWFNLGRETAVTARIVLAAQFASVLLYQFFQLLLSGIRCSGRTAAETIIDASYRLVNAFAIAIAAFTGGDLRSAALIALATSVVSLIVTAKWLNRKTPWLRLGYNKAGLVRVRELAGPSFSYMLVPLSNAMLIQAPLIILGAATTPATVALFGVTRTVARLGMAVANMVNRAFTSAYSFAYGHGDLALFKKRMQVHALLAAGGTLLFLVAGLGFGPLGVTLLSGGRIEPVRVLVSIMIVAVVFEMLWTALFTPLSAVNRHRKIAVFLALFSVLGIGGASLAVTTTAMASAIVVVHFCVFIVSAAALKKDWAGIKASISKA